MKRFGLHLIQRIRAWNLPDLLVFILLWPFLFLTSCLSPAWAVRLGKHLGTLAYYTDPRHRKVCLKNLKIAFPDLDDSERRQIGRRAFENVGKTFLEFPGLVRQKPADILRRVRFEGLENLDHALSLNKGALLLTGHIGNWELMALAYGLKRSPLAFIARPLDNVYLERWVARIRGRSGNQIIFKKGALRSVHRCLKQGVAVGFLVDQHSWPPDGILVDFFDHPACSSMAIALFAVRSGAPVVPVYTVRAPSGNDHIVIFESHLALAKTGKKDIDIRDNTQHYQKVLENVIRKYPDQWFWMHRRWKGSPTFKY